MKELLLLNGTAKVQIGSGAYADTFSFQVEVKDNYTHKSANLATTLVVYSCNPTGFTISPSTLTIEIEGASLFLNWT